MKYSLAAVLLIAVSLLSPGLTAQVTSQVSSNHINADENLQLTLESDAGGDWPELSVLEQDFYILNRSSSTNVHNFNGRTSRQTTIQLTLRPKKSGELTIPPIRFGEHSTRSHKIMVLGPVPEAPSSTQPQTFSPYPPGPGWFMPPAGGPQPWYAPRDSWDGPQSVTDSPRMAAAPDASPTPIEPVLRTGNLPHEVLRHWPWILAALLLGAGLVFFIARQPAKPPIQAVSVSDPDEPACAPPQPPQAKLDKQIEAVRKAYRDNDAYAAKQALLHWGEAAWPDDPPGNLSRLAARCSPEVQRHILRLEEALYSPKPVDWNQGPVGELLHQQGE